MTKAIVLSVEMGRASNRPLDPLYIEIDLRKMYLGEMSAMDKEASETTLDGENDED